MISFSPNSLSSWVITSIVDQSSHFFFFFWALIISSVARSGAGAFGLRGLTSGRCYRLRPCSWALTVTCERCFGGLHSFQTGFYSTGVAEALPNPPSVGSLLLSPSLSSLSSVFSLLQTKTAVILRLLARLHSFHRRALLTTTRLLSLFFFPEHLLAELFREAAVFSHRTCFSCH